jgi:hypothetical protein
MAKQSGTRLATGYFDFQGYVTGIHLVEIPEPASVEGHGARAMCGAEVPHGVLFKWKGYGIKYEFLTCRKCREIAWKLINPVWMLQAARHIADELHLEPQQERRVFGIIRWHALGRLIVYGLQQEAIV